jgi:hypothetical protein
MTPPANAEGRERCDAGRTGVWRGYDLGKHYSETPRSVLRQRLPKAAFELRCLQSAVPECAA